MGNLELFNQGTPLNSAALYLASAYTPAMGELVTGVGLVCLVEYRVNWVARPQSSMTCTKDRIGPGCWYKLQETDFSYT